MPRRSRKHSRDRAEGRAGRPEASAAVRERALERSPRIGVRLGLAPQGHQARRGDAGLRQGQHPQGMEAARGGRGVVFGATTRHNAVTHARAGGPGGRPVEEVRALEVQGGRQRIMVAEVVHILSCTGVNRPEQWA